MTLGFTLKFLLEVGNAVNDCLEIGGLQVDDVGAVFEGHSSFHLDNVFFVLNFRAKVDE